MPTPARIPAVPSPSGRHACAVCRRTTASTGALCFCCAQATRRLGLPLVPVVPLVEYRVGDPVHRLLRGYKDAHDEARRRACTEAAALLVAARWADQVDELAGRLGRWTAVAAVPSMRRPDPEDLLCLFAGVPAVAGAPRASLVLSAGPVAHLRADRRAFGVPADDGTGALRTARVLVVDDTVTTGAAGQSAAAALRLAGAQVAGILAVGRALPPSRSGRRTEDGGEPI